MVPGKWLAVAAVLFTMNVAAQEAPATPVAPAVYDEELAKRAGADENGMRHYVLVILKTGPTRVPDGEARQEMFRRHFANMERLSKEGKLAVAGPLDGVDGWRGLFILAVAEVEEAKKIVATDPVIIRGEMVAEYHKLYSSAALMLVPETHARLAKEK
jgi:uncharacterized protein YciI